jgi:hypothetical protein
VLEGKIGRFFVENTVKDDSQPSKVLRVEMENWEVFCGKYC